jgi:DNA polymerase I-like protein with 3'-5' exonuclease and polymerase domains
MDKRKHPEFRECIRADGGWKIVNADFSQQELRIVAYFSGDEKLKTIFLNGDDPHLETSSNITGRPITRDDSERDAAKRANFGFVFGGGVRSYRQTTLEDYGIVLTEEEGKRDQAAFREAWPGVYAWQKRFGSRRLLALDRFDHHPRSQRLVLHLPTSHVVPTNRTKVVLRRLSINNPLSKTAIGGTCS